MATVRESVSELGGSYPLEKKKAARIDQNKPGGKQNKAVTGDDNLDTHV